MGKIATLASFVSSPHGVGLHALCHCATCSRDLNLNPKSGFCRPFIGFAHVPADLHFRFLALVQNLCRPTVTQAHTGKSVLRKPLPMMLVVQRGGQFKTAFPTARLHGPHS